MCEVGFGVVPEAIRLAANTTPLRLTNKFVSLAGLSSGEEGLSAPLRLGRNRSFVVISGAIALAGESDKYVCRR